MIELICRATQKNVQFVTDAEGPKTAVILPIEEYEEMMEDLEMGRAARQSKAQPRRPFEGVLMELRAALEKVRLRQALHMLSSYAKKRERIWRGNTLKSETLVTT